MQWNDPLAQSVEHLTFNLIRPNCRLNREDVEPQGNTKRLHGLAPVEALVIWGQEGPRNDPKGRSPSPAPSPAGTLPNRQVAPGRPRRARGTCGGGPQRSEGAWD